MAGAMKVWESQKPKRAIRTTTQVRTPRNLTAPQAKKPRTNTSGRLTVTAWRSLSADGAAVGAGGQFGGGATVVVGGEAAARGGAGGGVLLLAPAVVGRADLDGADADHVAEAVRAGHGQFSSRRLGPGKSRRMRAA